MERNLPLRFEQERNPTHPYHHNTTTLMPFFIHFRANFIQGLHSIRSVTYIPSRSKLTDFYSANDSYVFIQIKLMLLISVGRLRDIFICLCSSNALCKLYHRSNVYHKRHTLGSVVGCVWEGNWNWSSERRWWWHWGKGGWVKRNGSNDDRLSLSLFVILVLYHHFFLVIPTTQFLSYLKDFCKVSPGSAWLWRCCAVSGFR